MTQIEIEFDANLNPNPLGTPAYMLARRESPSTSKAAAKDVAKKSAHLEQLVLDVIRSYPNGCISDDVRKALSDLPYSSVTARFSALVRKGRVQVTGEKRAGESGKHQRVLMAV
jgi:hypothetical protein